MPEPLKRKKKDGSSYERPPEIEELLKKLETVDVTERLRQFATLPKKSIGHVPSEALVYFLRRAWADGMQGDFEKLWTICKVRQRWCPATAFDQP